MAVALKIASSRAMACKGVGIKWYTQVYCECCDCTSKTLGGEPRCDVRIDSKRLVERSAHSTEDMPTMF